jgi:hypothetical protein
MCNERQEPGRTVRRSRPGFKPMWKRAARAAYVRGPGSLADVTSRPTPGALEPGTARPPSHARRQPSPIPLPRSGGRPMPTAASRPLARTRRALGSMRSSTRRARFARRPDLPVRGHFGCSWLLEAENGAKRSDRGVWPTCEPAERIRDSCGAQGAREGPLRARARSRGRCCSCRVGRAHCCARPPSEPVTWNST